MWLAALWLMLLACFAPASAAEATGVLKVKTNVGAAEVLLDGAPLGVAPLTKYIPAGTHKLRIVADNFDPFVRQIEIAADKTLDINATLTPGVGTLEFSGPPGARVTVAGQTYTLPIRVPPPAPGEAAWTAEAPGHEPTAGTLTVVRGRNHLVVIEMESSAGVVAISSKPAGARVTLDGKELGVTPVKVRDIAPGEHGVKLEAEGYAPAYRRLESVDGERASLEASLSKSGAQLSILGASETAVVALNGVEVGRGSAVQVPLVERGRVEVSVTDGDSVSIGKIDIPERGAVNARVQGKSVVLQKPLTQQWGFWAAVGGGAVAAGATTAVVVAATQPEPPPAGDVVVTLP